jgi:hypothetical protein
LIPLSANRFFRRINAIKVRKEQHLAVYAYSEILFLFFIEQSLIPDRFLNSPHYANPVVCSIFDLVQNFGFDFPVGSSPREFVTPTKNKNPEFLNKNWSWTFDVRD